jgi:alkylhydroperoxidase family enzyme
VTEGDKELADLLQNVYRLVILSAKDRTMLDFAAKLTLHLAPMTEKDVESPRRPGFSEEAVHDIVQVTGLFAYYDRLAEGLGIEPENGFDPT